MNGGCPVSKVLTKPFKIHIQSGQGNIYETIDELARQVVLKNVDEFVRNNYRVKKGLFWDMLFKFIYSELVQPSKLIPFQLISFSHY